MIIKEVTEHTCGRAQIEEGDTVFYGNAGGKLTIFES